MTGRLVHCKAGDSYTIIGAHVVDLGVTIDKPEIEILGVAPAEKNS